MVASFLYTHECLFSSLPLSTAAGSDEQGKKIGKTEFFHGDT